MSNIVEQIVERGMEEKQGKPNCSRCADEDHCLIAFMGPAIKIKPSYVAAPGCGRFEPKRYDAEENDADQGSE